MRATVAFFVVALRGRALVRFPVVFLEVPVARLLLTVTDFFLDTAFFVATFLVDAFPFASALAPAFFLLVVFLVAAFFVPVFFTAAFFAAGFFFLLPAEAVFFFDAVFLAVFFAGFFAAFFLDVAADAFLTVFFVVFFANFFRVALLAVAFFVERPEVLRAGFLPLAVFRPAGFLLVLFLVAAFFFGIARNPETISTKAAIIQMRSARKRGQIYSLFRWARWEGYRLGRAPPRHSVLDCNGRVDTAANVEFRG